MSEQSIIDPHGGYFFDLEIGNLSLAHFNEATGLKTSTTIFEIEEGGVNHMVHKLPGQSRYENIIMKFGVTGSVDLLEWRNMILKDQFDDPELKRNGAIILRSNDGEEVMRWEFVDAWPVSYEGPTLNSGSSEIAIETFEFAHHGLKVTKGAS
jgi:phage tail-like protein